MKAALVTLLACVCFTAAFARAENPPDSSLAAGYGSLVPIGSELDYSGLDRGYLNDPNTVVFPGYPVFPITTPVWHPDGKRIFYSDSYAHIRWVSDTGGKPHVVYESVDLYPHNGKNYVLHPAIRSLVGFSPDGSKLYFIRSVYSEGEIVINVDDQGQWAGVGGNALYRPDLECLDLDTGTVSTIAKDVFSATLSHGGQYMAFRENNTLTTQIMDLENNERWEIPIPDWTYFTADDQYLLCPGASLSRIPIRGGKKEPVIAFPGGDIAFSDMDMDPGGNWLLFTIRKDLHYRNLILNLHSGDTHDVLPSSPASTGRYARFSPDGKRFCYISTASNSRGADLYIKDIALPDADGPITDVAAEGIPVPLTLACNHPNPFNPATTIGFTLPASGRATLAVYSITGQKVRELVNAPLSAGMHSVVWDGRDSSGRPVSSGVYLTRLTMGKNTATARMLLAK